MFRYDTNSLASNSPIEDDSCCVILERDQESKVQGDLMFWGVFGELSSESPHERRLIEPDCNADGHSGWQTSRLLSSTLVSYVARELDLVFRSSAPYSSLLASVAPTAVAPSSGGFWSLFGSSPAKGVELDLFDPILQTAIKNSFAKLDAEIVQAPVRLLEKVEREGNAGRPGKGEAGMSTDETAALNTLLPALSGSCALLAFLDAGRNK